MTVIELIEELQNMPADATVVLCVSEILSRTIEEVEIDDAELERITWKATDHHEQGDCRLDETIPIADGSASPPYKFTNSSEGFNDIARRAAEAGVRFKAGGASREELNRTMAEGVDLGDVLRFKYGIDDQAAFDEALRGIHRVISEAQTTQTTRKIRDGGADVTPEPVPTYSGMDTGSGGDEQIDHLHFIKFEQGDPNNIVLKIDSNGDIFWKGRLVEHDKELVDALWEGMFHLGYEKVTDKLLLESSGMADQLGDGGWKEWSQEQAHEVEQVIDALRRRCCEKVADLPFPKARRIMAKALHDDEGLRQGYVANVAMLLHDRFRRITKHNRDEVAEAILALIFEYPNSNLG